MDKTPTPKPLSSLELTPSEIIFLQGHKLVKKGLQGITLLKGRKKINGQKFLQKLFSYMFIRMEGEGAIQLEEKLGEELVIQRIEKKL